jgi:hypothetical protein
MTELPAHSPLGASASERWMNCPGSVALIQKLTLEDTDEPEYRAHGTAAHAALAHCLTKGLDAWEVTGQVFENVEVSPEMADAIQVFIDVARPLMVPSAGYSPGMRYIEYPMSAKQFHPLFYGTVDFAVPALEDVPNHPNPGVPSDFFPPRNVLHVLDFKYGEGVIVEAPENPQLLYYIYGILLLHPEIELVRAAIVQPRVKWHPDGVVRWVEYTADYVRAWAEDILRPAMIATEIDGTLSPGEWCRFCPAKLICPALKGAFGAAAKADQREVLEFDDATLDREYQLVAGIKQYLKALEAEAFKRLNTGRTFAAIKLVQKKADRVWKPDAAARFTALFGDKAFSEPELLSPAQMEQLGSQAKDLVHEYAYTPNSGLTVALANDKRVGVKVQSTAEAFPGALQQQENENG